MLCLLVAGCTTARPYIAPAQQAWERTPTPSDTAQIYEVFLIGDAGDDPRSPALWLEVLNQFVLTGTYSLPDEHKGVTVKLGFQF